MEILEEFGWFRFRGLNLNHPNSSQTLPGFPQPQVRLQVRLGHTGRPTEQSCGLEVAGSLRPYALRAKEGGPPIQQEGVPTAPVEGKGSIEASGGTQLTLKGKESFGHDRICKNLRLLQSPFGVLLNCLISPAATS